MYVADGLFVKVYAPGASGDDPPVRSISVPDQPEWLAVDAAGYVYVTAGFKHIEVFAPGAGPSSPPVNTIVRPGSDFFMGVAVDASGTLYATGFARDVYVYNDPIHEAQPDRTFDRGRSAGGGPIAVDAEQNRFYYREYAALYDPWQAAAFGALNPGLTPIPGSRGDEWIFFSDKCYSRGSSGTMIAGLAINTNYLMFSCAETSSVLVYNNLPGRQRKVLESLTATGFGLGEMALGP